MGYRAKAPVVKVSIGAVDGNRIARFVREGAPIPEGVAQEQLDALEARGLIERDRAAAATADSDAPAGFDGPPAKNADKATWEAYARHVGVPEEDLAGKKKPEVIELALAAAGPDPDGSSDSGSGPDGDGGQDDGDSES